MKLEVERSKGRWYRFPWTATLYGDGNTVWVGFGIGATRASAIRRAFTNAADKVLKPDTPREDPVLHEEIAL